MLLMVSAHFQAEIVNYDVFYLKDFVTFNALLKRRFTGLYFFNETPLSEN